MKGARGRWRSPDLHPLVSAGWEQALANSSETVINADQPARKDLGFDPDVLREKYRAERDKRLRADGNP